jgi:hypothetical protein
MYGERQEQPEWLRIITLIEFRRNEWLRKLEQWLALRKRISAGQRLTVRIGIEQIQRRPWKLQRIDRKQQRIKRAWNFRRHRLRR